MDKLEERKKKIKKILEKIRKEKKAYHPPKGRFDKVYYEGLYFLEHGTLPTKKS